MSDNHSVVEDWVERALGIWESLTDNPDYEELVYVPDWHWVPGTKRVRFRKQDGSWAYMTMPRRVRERAGVITKPPQKKSKRGPNPDLSEGGKWPSLQAWKDHWVGAQLKGRKVLSVENRPLADNYIYLVYDNGQTGRKKIPTYLLVKEGIL